MLLLDVNDLGTDSISDVKGIEVVSVRSWDDFETVYWYIRKHPKKYKTITIDTITQIQRLCVLKVSSNSNKDAERAGEWGTMTKKDWGNVASAMKNWITNYRDLAVEVGVEVVFLAQDRVFSGDEDEEETSMLMPEVGPQLSPAVVKHLNASVDVIGYTYVRRKVREVGKGRKKREIVKTQYCLRIGPDPVYITKIRKPKKMKLPSVLVDPTYEDILGIIKGED